MMQKIIKAKGLVDVNQQIMVPDITLTIDNDLITAVESGTPSFPTHPESQQIDLSDYYILPGLINSHLHLCMAGDAEFGQSTNYQQNMKELAPLLAAKSALTELNSGVTTVRDCGAWDMPSICLAVDLGIMQSPRIFHCDRVLTMTGGHGGVWSIVEEVDGIEGIIQATRQNFKRGADFIKLMATGGGSPNTFPAHASFSVSEITAAVETAHRIDKKVSVHARGTAGISNVVEGGVDIIEHCCFELPDGTLKVDEKLIEKIARQEIVITPTIQLYRNYMRKLQKEKESGTLTAADSKSIQRLPYVLEEKHKGLRKFIEAGVKCMAGNDAGIGIVGYGTLSGELDTMVEGGMSPALAIASATKIPAETMGLFDEIGSLEAGKQTDIIAVKEDPTVNILALEEVSFVMKAVEIHLNQPA
jgi:imidazolonepropionase-like amidohydrolase